MSRHLLKPREAAERLHLTEGAVRLLIAEGRLASVRVGKRSYVPSDAPDRFLAEATPCHDETPARGLDTSKGASAGISAGASEDAIASAALALLSGRKLKSSSRPSSKAEQENQARVIRGRFS